MRPTVEVLQTSEEPPTPAQARAPTVYSCPALSNPVIVHLSGFADASNMHVCVPLMILTLYDSARESGWGMTVTANDSVDSAEMFIDTGARMGVQNRV